MRLFYALRNRTVAATLAAHGFDASSIDEGFRLLRAVFVDDVRGAGTPVEGLELEKKIAEWRRRWVPVLEPSLRRRDGDLADRLFPPATDAPKPYHAAVAFLQRYDELLASGDATSKEVVDLFAKRGFKTTDLDELRSLLSLAEPTAWPPADSGDHEQRLWGWYVEWSSIVRARVTDKRALRELGFGSDDESP